jgi:hypothetical protein
MIDIPRNTNLNLLMPILSDIYYWGKAFVGRISRQGMYKVLNYETSIELLDVKGEKAIVSKTEEVEFLQDNIIAFQDQAWGDGKILLNYKCSPGYPVDFYRSGHKTIILISLREVSKRGDMVQFKMKWGINRGFLKGQGFWTTDINHPTDKIKIEVVFPLNRPPKKVSVIESNTQRISVLSSDVISRLPDKRWLISWEKRNPRLNEHYILKWEW